MEDKKCERNNAKRSLTRAQNLLLEILDDNGDVDIVTNRYDEILTLRSAVHIKHEEYLASIEDASEERLEIEDVWLITIENAFIEVERKKVEYCKAVSAAEKQLKEEAVEDSEPTQKLLDASAAIATSKRLRYMEETSFNQYVRDFLQLLRAEGIDTSSYLVKDAYEQIKTQFTRCKELQNEYISLLDRDPETEEIDWILILQRQLSEVNVEFGAYPKNSDRPKHEERCPKISNELKVQPVKLPVFEGNVRDYPVFKQNFTKLIAPQMSNELACSYVLKSCLSGESADIVKKLDEMKGIWSRLDIRYGRPSKLIDAVMNELKCVKAIEDGDDDSLLRLIDIIEAAHRDLAMIGVEREISNSGCVSLIEQNLPRSVKREWSRHVNSKDEFLMSNDIFPVLLKFLQDQRNIIEYETSSLRNTEETRECLTNYASQRDNPEKRGKRYSCWIHKLDGHNLIDCRVFIEADAAERIKLVKDNLACWSCLKQGHRSFECKFRKRCTEAGCDKYHHETLHEAHSLGLILHALKEDKHSITNNCLLQIMEIESATSAPVNVLWDSGSTLSLITFEKADQLRIQGRKCKLNITGVGGKVQNVSSRVYTVGLRDESGNIVEFMVYGVEQISSEIISVNLKGVLHLFKSLKEEENCRPNGKIDVLIGYDYAGFHPIVVESSGHLLLLSNIFGKCLGGHHPLLNERTSKSSLLVNHASIGVTLEEFESLESLGIKCFPRCGNCQCRRCAIGSNKYSIKEERELKLNEDGFNLIDGVWNVTYPWKRDPKDLPDNKSMALVVLKSTERRLLKNRIRGELYKEKMQDMVTRGVGRKFT